MAVSIDYTTLVISVPQADLTFVTGTLYECDTDWLRLQLHALQASENGIPFEDAILHNTEVTVAGTTFARTIEMVNGYSVEFTPDAQWSVRLVGSNNNLFDVENSILVQNQVQVIPTNSGGLIRANLDTLESDVSAIQADVAAIETSITAIEGDVVTIQTDIGTLQTDMETATKIMRNKKITDEATGILTVYEDNGVDVWLTANLYESSDTSQQYRGQGIQRQERLT